MTLADLIESLQDLADELGEEKAAETEVRLAIQPRWAFEHSIAGVALSTDLETEDDGCPDCGAPAGRPHEPDCEGKEDAEEEDEPTVVYIAEGEQLGYAPPGIWEAAR